MNPSLSGLRRAAFIVTWATMAASTAAGQTRAAQTTPTPAGRGESGSPWHLSPTFRIGAEYDNNIFLLTSLKKDNVAAPSAAEVTSGRYVDMENARDIIVSLSAAFELKGPGLFAQSFRLTPSVAYDLYTQNSARSSATLGVSLVQGLWSGSRLRLQGRRTPKYFAKNYLADAVDADGSGSITDEERVYARGEYRESDISADFRFRLANSTKKRPFGAALQLGGGYYDRAYEAPFAGRDLHGPTAGVRLLLDLGRRVSVDLGYDFASLSATPTDQVQLLNEADFGQDFNGNGTFTDSDVRVVSGVDRSRREHGLGAAFHVALLRSVDLELGYEHRGRQYTSSEPLDPSNNGRRDARDQVGAELGFRLAKGLRMRLGGRHSAQSLNRTGDPGATGEVADYTKYQGNLGLSYDF